MKLNNKDKEVLKSMPKNEVSKIMDEWVQGTHFYTKNGRDWSPIEIIDKHFGPRGKELKTKLLIRAYELYKE